MKSSLRATIVVAVALMLTLGLASMASAAPWSDVDGTLAGSYGLSVDQIAQISSGYPDGSWQPWRSVTRAQFVKMAVMAFATDLADPSTPTFSDVPSTDHYYQYVEGAYAAGMVEGIGGGLFAPSSTMTREQAIAVVARQVAADEGFDLEAMSEGEIAGALDGFGDAASVSAPLRAEMAFAVNEGLVKGDAAGNLSPKAAMTRIAAAALLIRATAPAPLVLDSEDDGTTVAVEVGDIIQVVLKGNPTTGYSWSAALSDDDAALLEQLGEPVYVPDSDLVGAGGMYTFTFRAAADGVATLRLEYARPWESVPPQETYEVTVLIGYSPLEGTAWRLTEWSDASLDPGDFEITASFAGGRISGKAAVNLYFGPYTAGSEGSFSVGMLTQTEMAGSGPAMIAESTYLDLLRQARSYELEGARLTLMSADAQQFLIFRLTACP